MSRSGYLEAVVVIVSSAPAVLETIRARGVGVRRLSRTSWTLTVPRVTIQLVATRKTPGATLLVQLADNPSGEPQA